MNGFNSEELQTITSALDFYKYEMNKTENMDEYRAGNLQQRNLMTD